MSERYEIKGEIGRGGLGIVYRAYDSRLGRDVAIKRIRADSGEKLDELTTNLLSEAKALSALNHPHIVTVHDVGQDEEGAYVVMELLEGENLDTVIERAPLPVEDFREFAVQTIEGLVAAQSVGLVHRDLKPPNIMLVWLPSGKFQVKILDFGLAKFSRKPSTQTTGHADSILGSIYFMAPEQFERAPLDARTDLYAIGAIFYYTLAGRYPFDGDNAVEVMTAHLQHRLVPLQQLRPDVPDCICAWLERLMARNMEDRPADAREALDTWCPEPVIDETQLREAASGDRALAAELLAGFLEETGALVRQVAVELESGQCAEAEETARTIRGTASTLGYTEVISIALEIENNAHTDRDGCRAACVRFAPALGRLESAVSRLEWPDGEANP
jgi:serine/threonine protein kinase